MYTPEQTARIELDIELQDAYAHGARHSYDIGYKDLLRIRALWARAFPVDADDAMCEFRAASMVADHCEAAALGNELLAMKYAQELMAQLRFYLLEGARDYIDATLDQFDCERDRDYEDEVRERDEYYADQDDSHAA